MNELLPCPFCNGKADLVGGIRGSIHVFYVECVECESIGEKFGLKNGDEARASAIEAWNKRHQPLEPMYYPSEERLNAFDVSTKYCKMFPKYQNLLAFVKELTEDFPDRDNYREYLQEQAKELLKEIGEE